MDYYLHCPPALSVRNTKCPLSSPCGIGEPWYSKPTRKCHATKEIDYYIYCPPFGEVPTAGDSGDQQSPEDESRNPNCPASSCSKHEAPWYSPSSKHCHHAKHSVTYIYCPPGPPTDSPMSETPSPVPQKRSSHCPEGNPCSSVDRVWYSPHSKRCHHLQHSVSYLFCPPLEAFPPTTAVSTEKEPSRHPACPSDKCTDMKIPWYSPRSTNCHHTKHSDYYIFCPPLRDQGCPDASCSKAEVPWYSPSSGGCHHAKHSATYIFCPPKAEGGSVDAVLKLEHKLSQRNEGCPDTSCYDEKIPWYSPRSQHCHHAKHSDYYIFCPPKPGMARAPSPPVAMKRDSECPPGKCMKETPWYSPNSDRCHHGKHADYYLYCPPASIKQVDVPKKVLTLAPLAPSSSKKHRPFDVPSQIDGKIHRAEMTCV